MIQSAHRIRSYKQADLQMGLTSGGIEGLHAVVLDEDEERVLHLPRRELEAADDLLQRQRAVAEQAAAHLLREGIGRRRLGHTSTRRRRRSARGGGSTKRTMEGEEAERRGGRLTDTRGPKWSEMMATARRIPCCDTMVAGGEVWLRRA